VCSDRRANFLSPGDFGFPVPASPETAPRQHRQNSPETDTQFPEGQRRLLCIKVTFYGMRRRLLPEYRATSGISILLGIYSNRGEEVQVALHQKSENQGTL